MDNTTLLLGRPKDESADVVPIAEAAATGAKNAVLQEVQRAEQAAMEEMEVRPGPNRASPTQAMVAGLVPLSRAEIVAAEGALKAVQLAVCLLPPEASKLVSGTDLLEVQTAAAIGGATGVRGSAFLTPLAANTPAILDKNLVATAAGSGAYAACYNILRAVPRRPTVNQWASRLPPVLGASMALAAGAYSGLTSSDDRVVSILYGGLVLVIFMLMVGIVAVPFRSNMSPESVSRNVTFASFTTLILLLTIVLCTMLSGIEFIIPVGIVGGLAAASLVYLWWLSSRCHRTG